MGILQKMESLNQLISASSERMCTHLDRIVKLITDKKLMKRYFSEERDRIDCDLDQVLVTCEVFILQHDIPLPDVTYLRDTLSSLYVMIA